MDAVVALLKSLAGQAGPPVAWLNAAQLAVQNGRVDPRDLQLLIDVADTIRRARAG